MVMAQLFLVLVLAPTAEQLRPLQIGLDNELESWFLCGLAQACHGSRVGSPPRLP